MKKSEWNDEQLEHLLMQMPTVKDNRNPQEIYQNISSKVVKKRKKTWIMPTLATSAALLLLLIVFPSFMNEFGLMDSALDKSETNASKEMFEAAENKQADSSVQNEQAELEIQEERNMFALETNFTNQYIVKSYDSATQNLLSFAVTDSNAQFVIPLTIIIDANDQDALEQMGEVIPRLNNVLTMSNWGLSTFELNDVTFSETSTTNGKPAIKADFSENPSHLANNFSQIISETLRWLDNEHYEVHYYLNGSPGIEISNIGPKEVDSISKYDYRAYYYYEAEGSDRKFLVPEPSNNGSKNRTLDEALEAMKNPLTIGGFQLLPTIYDDVSFEVTETAKAQITISFDDRSGLANDEGFLLMLNAMLLTAREFGIESVTFEGNIGQIGDIPFGVPLNVPLAANLITLP